MCKQCEWTIRDDEQIDNIDLINHKYGEPIHIVRYCKMCGRKHSVAYKENNPKKDGTICGIYLNINWSDTVKDLERFADRYNEYFNDGYVEFRNIQRFGKEMYPYSRAFFRRRYYNKRSFDTISFEIPAQSLLAQCGKCRKIGNPKKIRVRWEYSDSFDIDGDSGILTSTLCNKCWSDILPMIKMWSEYKKNRSIINKLNVEIRHARKRLSESNNQDNGAIAGVLGGDDGTG